jgi:hypothetical protein
MSGNSYISSLYSQIEEYFRFDNPRMTPIIQGHIDNGNMRGLYFADGVYPITSPRANFATKNIELQEGFLSYLWTVCYFMIGLAEIYHDMASTGKPVVNLADSSKFQTLNNTFAWGKSLNEPELSVEGLKWPAHIANPFERVCQK